MKKFVALLIVAGLVYGYVHDHRFSLPWSPTSIGFESVLQEAFANRESNVQVQGEGIVTRILADDLDGSRHQRFILNVGSGQTILISHNIDLAPRIEDLRTGDSVEFFGEYEWNGLGPDPPDS